MIRYSSIFILAFVLFACKSKKEAEDDGTVEVGDFLAYFQERTLPVINGDSTLSRRERDSSAIAAKNFKQFVPDSVFVSQFGKTGKPRIFPLGKVSVKKAETYLFVKAILAAKRAIYVLVFDKESKFASAMLLLAADSDPATVQSATMDNRYTITTLIQRTSNVKQTIYRKNAYVFTPEGFVLIMTESNDVANTSTELINPIILSWVGPTKAWESFLISSIEEVI